MMPFQWCKSLSDGLLPGPSLNKLLDGVLMRFLLHGYAFSADIETTFLQHILDKLNRDFI